MAGREDRNKAIVKLKGETWATNAAANRELWQANKHGVDELYNSLGDAPKILLGPGPSLDLVIPMLAKPFAPGLVKIACNTALNPLIGRGVIPDIVVAYDAAPEVATQIQEAVTAAPADAFKSVALICPTTVDPAGPKTWPGPVYWFSQSEHSTPETGMFFDTLAAQYKGLVLVENVSCVFNVMVLLASRFGNGIVFSCGFEYPTEPTASYGATRYQFAPSGSPVPIPGTTRKVDWKIRTTHQNYATALLSMIHIHGIPFINLSPLASFRDFVMTLPTSALLTGEMEIPEGMKVNG